MKGTPSSIKVKFYKIFFYSAYIVLILLLVETSSRICLIIRKGTPFSNPGEVIYSYYPELKEARRGQIVKGDNYFDVLILGASVLNSRWSNIEQLLREGLSNQIKKEIRITNLSQLAHSSLDSYYKYKYLKDKSFDVVLFYHGINEVRANNVPPQKFRADYSHYSWYEELKIVEMHRELKWLATPYVIHYVFNAIRRKAGLKEYVPTHQPKEEWISFGSSIKTRECFRKNLFKIIEIANEKNEQFVLMTNSFYIPDNYSLENFENKSLDYGEHLFPVEFYGKPENVNKGITVHNEVIREAATRYKNIIFIDQDSLIQKNGRNFNDICHFTEKGCEEFADNILTALKSYTKRLPH